MSMPGLEDDIYDDFDPDDGMFNVEPDLDLRSDDTPDIGAPPGGDDDPGLTRDEKKRARYDEIQRERDEWKRKAEEAEQRARWFPGQQQNYQQFAPPQAQQPTADPEVTRIESEVQTIQQRREELEGQWADAQQAGTLTAERVKTLNKQYRELDRQETVLHVKLDAARSRPTPEQQQMAQRAQYVHSRWPDIASDPEMFNHASSLVAAERRREPTKQFTDEDYNRIAEQTRVAFNIKAPPASEAQRIRYSGHGVGSNGGGAPEAYPTTLSQEEMRMAIRSNPGMPKKQAMAKFYREVKLPLLKEDAARRRFAG